LTDYKYKGYIYEPFYNTDKDKTILKQLSNIINDDKIYQGIYAVLQNSTSDYRSNINNDLKYIDYLNYANLVFETYQNLKIYHTDNKNIQNKVQQILIKLQKVCLIYVECLKNTKGTAIHSNIYKSREDIQDIDIPGLKDLYDKHKNLIKSTFDSLSIYKIDTVAKKLIEDYMQGYMLVYKYRIVIEYFIKSSQTVTEIYDELDKLSIESYTSEKDEKKIRYILNILFNAYFEYKKIKKYLSNRSNETTSSTLSKLMKPSQDLTAHPNPININPSKTQFRYIESRKKSYQVKEFNDTKEEIKKVITNSDTLDKVMDILNQEYTNRYDNADDKDVISVDGILTYSDDIFIIYNELLKIHNDHKDSLKSNGVNLIQILRDITDLCKIYVDYLKIAYDIDMAELQKSVPGLHIDDDKLSKKLQEYETIYDKNAIQDIKKAINDDQLYKSVEANIKKYMDICKEVYIRNIISSEYSSLIHIYKRLRSKYKTYNKPDIAKELLRLLLLKYKPTCMLLE
jgi:regulator of replication initiation timing